MQLDSIQSNLEPQFPIEMVDKIEEEGMHSKFLN